METRYNSVLALGHLMGKDALPYLQKALQKEKDQDILEALEGLIKVLKGRNHDLQR